MISPRMDMDGMDSGSSSSSSSSSSAMTMSTMGFYTSTSTTLYSTAWTPSSAGAYAGTCIFLIVLAALGRCLLALRSWKETRWLDAELARRYVVVSGREPLSERVARDGLAKRMVLSENGVEEDVMVVSKAHTHVRPWRLSVDPVRAAIDTAGAGVAYLLMLAVMTMNVGYFLSVLGGVFLGSLLVGRYILVTEH